MSSDHDYVSESHLLAERARDLRNRVDGELRKVRSPSVDLPGWVGYPRGDDDSRERGQHPSVSYLPARRRARLLAYMGSLWFPVHLMLVLCAGFIVYSFWDDLGWGWLVVIAIVLLQLPLHVPDSIRDRLAKRQRT